MTRIRSQTEVRRYFIGGIGCPDTDQGALLSGQGDVEPEDLWANLAVTEDLNRRWYETITGRMPIDWHVVAVCYATAAIFLGWWPWNFLLLLLPFPIRNKRVRFYGFRTVAAKESMRSRMSYKRWSSV
jgi:hypothetical protein